MTTSMDSTKQVTIKTSDTYFICSDFFVSQDKNAITVSMSIRNEGKKPLLLSVNNFCLVENESECYAQHCYISDGHSFEVISGWKSFSKGKNYTLITKYSDAPNLSTCNLCYKATHEQFTVTEINL